LPAQLPDLAQSLHGRDLSFLRAVAELWDIPLNAPDARAGLQRLLPALQDPVRVSDVVDGLPASARTALNDLIQAEGRLSWSRFTRRYGSVREMGPGRRDRERPHRRPASAGEALWYHALVCRAFFDTPDGPQEFAYIPLDLLDRLPVIASETSSVLGRAASPAERALPQPPNDSILDDACTLLAALRLGLSVAEISALSWSTASPHPLAPGPLQALLSAAGLLDESGMPQPEPVRLFLEAPRSEALASLARSWMRSPDFNELRQVPGLRMEGDWRNDPLRARQAVLDFLTTLPADTWWSLPAFLAALRLEQPDFQRPAGDYDSWFIRDEASGEFLRGFERWEEVDGALVRYLLGGPMHWLGLVELARPADDGPLSAFRLTPWAQALLKGEALPEMPPDDARLFVSSEGRVTIPRRAPRAARYQAARFCLWEGEREDGYRYRLTPASLLRAREQGLRLPHLLGLLRRYAEFVPPNVVKALERWEAHGSEARVEQVTVLRLSTPELLASLRASRAGRFLGEPLGPTSVIVKPGGWKKVLAALAEMGYLGESTLDEDRG
jgi:hypothetical protein